METFPAYAKISFDGFAEKRESALLRSDMESGPPKQARIKSRVLVNRPVKILLESLADYESFKSWFATSINEGDDWFEWTDPVSGTVKTARFSEGGLNGQPTVSTLCAWVISTSIETWG